MVSDSAFIFQMWIPCGRTFSCVPRSRSSVKVKYQGHISFSKRKALYHWSNVLMVSHGENSNFTGVSLVVRTFMVPKSRSSIINYQGHFFFFFFSKNAVVAEALVFYKHDLFPRLRKYESNRTSGFAN